MLIISQEGTTLFDIETPGTYMYMHKKSLCQKNTKQEMKNKNTL